MAKTSQPTDYDVFISYSHRDRGRVEQLREQLTRSGLSVWWDEHIYSGDRFVAEIFEHIAQCGVVLVCWSRNSRERPWVQMEADHAEKEKKTDCFFYCCGICHTGSNLCRIYMALRIYVYKRFLYWSSYKGITGRRMDCE